MRNMVKVQGTMLWQSCSSICVHIACNSKYFVRATAVCTKSKKYQFGTQRLYFCKLPHMSSLFLSTSFLPPPHFYSPPPQPVTNYLWGWQPSLAPPTALRPTQSSPSATRWACPTFRPNGSTRCQITGTRTTSASTQTSPPWARPYWTWSISSSGGLSLLSTTTAQVQVQLSQLYSCLWWCCMWPVQYQCTLEVGKDLF